METLPLPVANGNGHAIGNAVQANGNGYNGGPKTEAGKAQSRLNAIKHRLSACDLIFMTGLPHTHLEAYLQLRQMLRRHYRPVAEYERLLVDSIAVAHYRQLCLHRLEGRTLSNHPDNLQSDYSIAPHLDRFSRYDMRTERRIRLLHNRLAKLYKERGVTSLKPYILLE